MYGEENQSNRHLIDGPLGIRTAIGDNCVEVYISLFKTLAKPDTQKPKPAIEPSSLLKKDLNLEIQRQNDEDSLRQT